MYSGKCPLTIGNVQSGQPGQKQTHYTMPRIWKELKEQADMASRAQRVAEFNAQHAWRKRGIAMTPVKYGVSGSFAQALVNVYADGSVNVHHSGVEIGQGIHTKVLAVASFELGKVVGSPVPMSLLRAADTDTAVVPNMKMTGGSTSSEESCFAIAKACRQLVDRLAPIHAKMAETAEGKVTWEALIAKAKGDNVNLMSQGCFRATDDGPPKDGDGAADDGTSGEWDYLNYGAAVSEVEVDIVTGEVEILRTDLLYDCGKSLNPAVDIGQCEGGFMMGVGHLLREKVWIDESTGQLVSDGTWEYKPPSAMDVPKEFNVRLLEDTRFDKGFLSSKASGEPPLVLSTSVAMAAREAVRAARTQTAALKDTGGDAFFRLDTPIMVDDIANAADPSRS